MFRTAKAPLRRLGVRYNSNESNNSVFLSDLFKRIEQVTSKAKEVKPLPKTQPSANKKKTFTKKRTGAPQSDQVQQRPNVIKVQDHSLMNSFGQSYAQFATTGVVPQTAGGSRVRNNSRPRNNRQGATSATASTQVTSTSATTRPVRKTARPQRPRAPVKAGEKDGKAPSKALSPSPLVPELTGDTFFYGKITSVNPCVSSRVASIAKEALIESKYPYLVPKNIIQNLPEEPKNKFLLQNNYSLEVDESKLLSRFDQVVKGNHQKLEHTLKTDQAKFTEGEIMKNGTLNFEHKKSLFEIVNGLKSPKSLFANAAWAKK